jgi:hypothetical protein
LVDSHKLNIPKNKIQGDWNLVSKLGPHFFNYYLQTHFIGCLPFFLSMNIPF